MNDSAGDENHLKPKKRVSLTQRTTQKFKVNHPSIAELENNEAAAEEERELETVDESAPVNDFSEEDFMQHWKSLIQEQYDKGNKSVAVGMKDAILRSDYQIEVLVDNQVQVSKIQQQKIIIVEKLRKKLQNGRINLTTRLKAKDEKKEPDQFESDQDKFEKLAEKNPALLEMRKRFKLDIEY